MKLRGLFCKNAFFYLSPSLFSPRPRGGGWGAAAGGATGPRHGEVGGRATGRARRGRRARGGEGSRTAGRQGARSGGRLATAMPRAGEGREEERGGVGERGYWDGVGAATI
jgi:hypothetical protein